MTENYGIEGWNSPSIFSFLCRINNGGCSGKKYYFRFYIYLFYGCHVDKIRIF